mgnify:CR=1 FL=1|jgi:hypothetical protein
MVMSEYLQLPLTAEEIEEADRRVQELHPLSHMKFTQVFTGPG